jgi:hypothetical protein
MTLEGLVGILRSKQFFLSDMRATTDPQELRYGVQLIRDVLQNDCPSDRLSELTLRFWSEDDFLFFGKRVFCHATCFCDVRDHHHHWTGCGSGGVAIGFKLESLGHPTFPRHGALKIA